MGTQFKNGSPRTWYLPTLSIMIAPRATSLRTKEILSSCLETTKIMKLPSCPHLKSHLSLTRVSSFMHTLISSEMHRETLLS